jgi:hypothetical protein
MMNVKSYYAFLFLYSPAVVVASVSHGTTNRRYRRSVVGRVLLRLPRGGGKKPTVLHGQTTGPQTVASAAVVPPRPAGGLASKRGGLTSCVTAASG